MDTRRSRCPVFPTLQLHRRDARKYPTRIIKTLVLWERTVPRRLQLCPPPSHHPGACSRNARPNSLHSAVNDRSAGASSTGALECCKETPRGHISYAAVDPCGNRGYDQAVSEGKPRSFLALHTLPNRWNKSSCAKCGCGHNCRGGNSRDAAYNECGPYRSCRVGAGPLATL